jgi:hypothetical protein
MTSATCCHRDDVAALALGIGLLCAGTLSLIGAAGLVFWMLGMH